MTRSNLIFITIRVTSNTKNTSSVSFISPEEKGSCKMVDASNVSELVDLLHNEAKII